MRPNQLLSARDLLSILFKKNRLIAAIFCTSVSLALVYSLFAVPRYRAEVRLLVKLGKEKLSAVASVPGGSYNVLFQERAQNVHNELEILESGTIDEEVLQEVGTLHAKLLVSPRTGISALRWRLANALRSTRELALAPLYALGVLQRKTARERFVKDLEDSLDVEVIEDTDMIEVGFTWWDPYFAAYALNRITHAYLLDHMHVHASEGSQAFYVEQIGLYEQKLAQLETELDRFLQDGRISSMEVQKELLLKEVAELEALRTEASLAETSARLKGQRVRAMYGTPEMWIETPDIDDEISDLRALDNAYFELKRQRDRLLDTFVPESREIQRLESQMRALRDQKTESLLSALGVLERVRGEERTLIEAKIADRQVALDGLIGATLPLAALQRERAVTEKTYLIYKEKAEELRISDDMNRREITSISIVRETTPPREHAWPKRKLIVAVAGVLGLFLGLGYAFCSELLDHTFRDPEDVGEVLQFPVLASVPDVSGPQLSEGLDQLSEGLDRLGGHYG